MRTRITFPLLAFILVAGCGREAPPSSAGGGDATAATTAAKPAPAKTATVKLRVTGIAHLLGDNGATTRALVVPNLTSASHQPLLLARKKFFAASPSTCRPQLTKGNGEPEGNDPTTCANYETSYPGMVYHYTPVTPGVKIDLTASGIRKRGSLTFSEEGDADSANQKPNLECSSSEAQEASLHWLPRLRTAVHAEKAKLKQSLVRPDPQASDVAVRLDIDYGVLEAELPGVPDRFHFRVRNAPPADDHIQALAEYLVYTFDVDLDANGFFNLKGTDLASGKPVTLGSFKPQGGSIEILLANVIPDDFFLPKKLKTIPHLHHNLAILEPPVEAEATRGEACEGKGLGGDVECGPDRP